MPLIQPTGLQYQQLRDAIIAAFQEPDFSDFLLFKLDLHYDDLSSGPNYQAKVVSILKYVVKEGRIIELLTKVTTEKPLDLTLQKLTSELAAFIPSPGVVDHYEVCCLSGSHVMVNRARLRTALRELCKPLGKRILIVKGGAKNGKTHSLQLIAYLNQVLDTFRLVPVDLEQVSSALPQSRIHAEILAGQIVSRLDGYNKKQLLDDPPDDKQRASWVLNFLNELELQSKNDSYQRWIIIDHLQKVNLPEPTLDLIKGLAGRINLTLTNFRLILLDYKDSFSPEVLPHVEEETIARIDQGELTKFFSLAFKQRQRAFTDDDVAKAVHSVLSQVDFSQSGYLISLEIVAAKELRKVLEGGD